MTRCAEQRYFFSVVYPCACHVLRSRTLLIFFWLFSLFSFLPLPPNTLFNHNHVELYSKNYASLY